MEIIKIRVELNGEVPAKKELQEIDKLIDRLNKKTVSPKAPNQTAQDVVNLNKNMSRLNELTGQATKQTGLWGNALSMIKFTAIAAGIAAVTGSLKSALTEMKAVDTQLTNIQKVSNMTAAELDKIGDKAYATASKYGVAANEYLSAVYTFQKAGLGDAADQLGELATKTMLVGDTSAEVASKFLIAVNAAWEMGGSMEKLSTVVDEADYINNNYATSLENLAAALPIVASTAANMNMSIEETLAAIGTMQAKTQDTPKKIGTAWRALIMNITKETGELVLETGETVEVTQESIKRLSDALEIYGNDAVQAARASGQIIDPMEALNSLAQAYRDGLLTDVELMNILIDTGGKLRTNPLTTLVKDLASETSTYYDIMSKLPDAAGTADSEINIMLSSWESKTKILKNTWTEFVQKSIQTDTVKGILDVATALLDFGGNIGQVVVVVGSLTTAIKLLTSAHNANKAATEAAAIADEIAAMAKRGAATEVEALTAAEKANELQTKAMASGWKTAVSGAAIGIAAYTMALQAWNQHRENQIRAAQESIDAANKEVATLESQGEKITELTEKYKELYASGDSTSSEREALQEQIVSLIGKEVEGIDLANGKYEEQLGILGKISGEIDDQTRKAYEKQSFAYGNALLENTRYDGFWDANMLVNAVYAGNQQYISDVQKLTEGLSSIQYGMNRGQTGFYVDYGKTVDEVIAAYDDLVELQDRYIEWADREGADLSSNVLYQSVSDEINKIEEYAEAYKKLQEVIASGDEEAIEEAQAAFDAVASAAEDAAGGIENVTEAMQRLKDVASEDTGFQSMSDAVAKFRDMIDAGEVNSRAFWNTAEFLFGPEVLDEYYGNAQGLIDLFENSNLEEVFDGESLDGFIESLRQVDDSIAQVSETADGTTSFVINDVDALAEAWGMTKTQVLALIEAAEAFGELDFTGNGLIDYLDYLGVAFENGKTTTEDVTAALSDLGYTTQYIEGVVSALEDMGAIDMSGTQSEAEATAESADNVAGAADAASTSTQNLNNQTLGNVTGQFDGLSTAATNAATNVNNTATAVDNLDGKTATTTITTNYVQTYTTVGQRFAQGTRNAAGGPALVGDEYSPSGKPKPELIVDNGTAWIGGMNGPEIVRLSPGAQVYTYDQTRRMMQGTAFTTAMPAFASGTSNIIKITYNANGGTGGPTSSTATKGSASLLSTKKPTRSGYTFQGWARTSSATSAVWQPGGKITAYSNQTLYAVWKKNSSGASGSYSTSSSTSSSSSSSGGGGGSYSSGGGGGGSSGSSGSSSSSSTTSTRDKMMKDIEATLEDKEFAIWLGLKNGTMTAEEAAKAYRELMDYVSSKSKQYAEMGDTEKSSYIQKLQKQWFEYYDELTDMQGDLMSELKESLNRQLSAAQQVDALEEKRLALIEAQEALTNAQTERTVRIYNAATGQWEWVADAKAVQTAQENLKNAQDALADEEIRQAINAVTSSMEEPGRPIESILADINAIGTDRQKEAASGAAAASAAIEEMYGVSDLGEEANKAITQIGSTFFITQEPAKISGAASAITRQLTGNTMGSGSKLADAAQANADRRTQYFIDGVEISDNRARTMTLADLAQSLSSLAVYNNT